MIGRLSTYLILILHSGKSYSNAYQFTVIYISVIITYNMHLFHLSNNHGHRNIDPGLSSIDYLILMFSIIKVDFIEISKMTSNNEHSIYHLTEHVSIRICKLVNTTLIVIFSN